MVKFYMDEAGYTGYDLLNSEQRFQGAATIRIGEGDAAALIREHFPKTKLVELKYRKLAKRKGNWEALLNLQRSVLQDHLGITYVCDKRYVLTLQFLDYCLEPVLYENGIDFYEDGQNYSLASLLYRTASSFWGAENFEEILSLFQRALRSKSDVTIQALVEKSKALRGRELSEYLLPLASEHPACLREIRTSPINTDAAFIVILSLISHIEKFVDSSYEVVHDVSENLNQYGKVLAQLASAQSSESFHQTTITTLNFPLKLSGVSQVDSKKSSAIQLADVLVGGMIEHCNSLIGQTSQNEYNQAIPALYGETNLIHLLPNLNFEENKVFRQGTQAGELIDFFARNFR